MIRAFLQRHPLPAIVIAQLCGTSLWFSVNGVWLSLSRELEFSEAHLGFLTLSASRVYRRHTWHGDYWLG